MSHASAGADGVLSLAAVQIAHGSGPKAPQSSRQATGVYHYRVSGRRGNALAAEDPGRHLDQGRRSGVVLCPYHHAPMVSSSGDGVITRGIHATCDEQFCPSADARALPWPALASWRASGPKKKGDVARTSSGGRQLALVAQWEEEGGDKGRMLHRQGDRQLRYTMRCPCTYTGARQRSRANVALQLGEAVARGLGTAVLARPRPPSGVPLCKQRASERRESCADGETQPSVQQHHYAMDR